MSALQFSPLPIGSRTLFTVVHGDEPPNLEEWGSLMTSLGDYKRRHEGDMTAARLLFFSDGGMPDVGMRGDLFRAINAPVPIAVITESEASRSVVTAMHWADPNARHFAAADAEKSLKHLALTPLEIRTLLVPALRLLRAQASSKRAMLERFLEIVTERIERAQAHH